VGYSSVARPARAPGESSGSVYRASVSPTRWSNPTAGPPLVEAVAR